MIESDNNKKRADDRAARRAAALRSNLSRRKAQTRARNAEDGSEGGKSDKPELKKPQN